MIPLIVNNPDLMLKLRLVTLRDSARQALKILQKIGVLHIEESRELKPVDKAAVEDARREVGDLLSFVDKILGYLPEKETVALDEGIEVIYTQPFGEIAAEVRKLYNKTDKLHERIGKLTSESVYLKELHKYLGPVSVQADLNLKDLRFSGDFIFSGVLVLSNDAWRGLKDELKKYAAENIVVTVEEETVVHVVAETRYRVMVESLVAGAGGRILEIPEEDTSLRAFLDAAGGRLEKLDAESQKLLAELREQIGGDLKRLVLLREALFAENERLLVLEKASEAKYVTLIEGWIPKTGSDEAIGEIREKIDYAFTDVREPERDEEPPTKYNNPAGFKPFQVVVNLFATPKYREWDPTPIITYSFAFFFGLMVCDVLYGIGIILMAKFLLKKFVDDDTTPAFKMFQNLLYICSGVAIVGGLLTGQYFGDIFKFFGINSLAISRSLEITLQNPVTFIVIALVIGFIHVNIGHTLAFIKAIKQRDKGVIVGKIGLFLLELGLPIILNSILGVNIPGFTPQIYSILSYIMLGGVVLIVISNLMVSGGLGSIMWLFDITGLLGDVMSYARLAGVSLATYYLAFTFNMLAKLFADMLSGSVFGVIIGILLGVVLIVFGHAINLVMAAISGFMHSLRLCFVEFLFKFYEGGGTEYNPFKLRRRASVSVAAKS